MRQVPLDDVSKGYESNEVRKHLCRNCWEWGESQLPAQEQSRRRPSPEQLDLTRF